MKAVITPISQKNPGFPMRTDVGHPKGFHNILLHVPPLVHGRSLVNTAEVQQTHDRSRIQSAGRHTPCTAKP